MLKKWLAIKILEWLDWWSVPFTLGYIVWLIIYLMCTVFVVQYNNQAWYKEQLTIPDTTPYRIWNIVIPLANILILIPLICISIFFIGWWMRNQWLDYSYFVANGGKRKRKTEEAQIAAARAIRDSLVEQPDDNLQNAIEVLPVESNLDQENDDLQQISKGG